MTWWMGYVVVGLCTITGTSIYDEMRYQQLLTRVVESDLHAREAELAAEQLTSTGRFVRSYDPKQGTSIYVYATDRANRFERVRLCGWQNWGRAFP